MRERCAQSPLVGGSRSLLEPLPVPPGLFSAKYLPSDGNSSGLCPGLGPLDGCFATAPPSNSNPPITARCASNDAACLCRVPGAGRSCNRPNAPAPLDASTVTPRRSKNARAFCSTRSNQFSSEDSCRVLLRHTGRESAITRLLFPNYLWSPTSRGPLKKQKRLTLPTVSRQFQKWLLVMFSKLS